MITLASGWGERVGEPDAWSGEYLGFPVYARRNSMGVWCGYIGLPTGHPWSGLSDPHNVAVHGGISYAQKVLPLTDPGGASAWYLGFNCGHFGDFIPSFVAAEPGVDPLATATRLHATYDCHIVYRTLEYAQAELRSLAEQASRVAQG